MTHVLYQLGDFEKQTKRLELFTKRLAKRLDVESKEMLAEYVTDKYTKTNVDIHTSPTQTVFSIPVLFVGKIYPVYVIITSHDKLQYYITMGTPYIDDYFSTVQQKADDLNLLLKGDMLWGSPTDIVTFDNIGEIQDILTKVKIMALTAIIGSNASGLLEVHDMRHNGRDGKFVSVPYMALAKPVFEEDADITLHDALSNMYAVKSALEKQEVNYQYSYFAPENEYNLEVYGNKEFSCNVVLAGMRMDVQTEGNLHGEEHVIANAKKYAMLDTLLTDYAGNANKAVLDFVTPNSQD